MEINQFTKEEKIALVGLIEHLLMADNVVSYEESEALRNVVAEIGEHDYRSLIHDYRPIIENLDSFKQFLINIERQEPREIIYGTLFEIAESDFFEENESELLDWLAKEWELDINIEKEDTGSKS
ncbi:MAG: TerB family tellurite resistance protein [Ignavibacteriae bacterium]|nr:TerB family tellurite resistance protein [Ignavibacteriota bacterium]